MLIDLDRNPPRAILVAIQSQRESDELTRLSLEELRRLCKTLGLEVVEQLVQKRSAPSAALVLGTGKVAELKGLIEQLRAKDLEALAIDPGAPMPEPREIMVVFDDALSPSQTLHLSEAVGAQVLDRNTVILEIFHNHARTRLAQLQVEIVRLEYQAPRVRTGANRADRGGGIGAKGKGESHIEIDRRKIRDRIAELRIELARVEKSQEQKRRGRGLQVALVGYTNAGKSTLMRGLTGSEVYVADKLFATLDTRVRQLQPPTRPPVLVSDTVGFIKKLPHGLVNSFRATLDEALDASLLLHVVDASSGDWRGELATTVEVLEEIGAGDRPRQLVFNKIDKLTLEDLLRLRGEHPDALYVSALDPNGVGFVRQAIVRFMQAEMGVHEVTLPFDQHALVSYLHENTSVQDERHDEAGTTLRFLCSPQQLEVLRARLGGTPVRTLESAGG